MADAEAVRRDAPLLDLPWANSHALGVTTVLTVIAYALVGLTFGSALPWPSIPRSTVVTLADVVTFLNAVSLVLLCTGWYFIRNGDVRNHRRAMLSGVTTIIVFLVLYLEKVGGGGTMTFAGPNAIKYYVYLPLLGIHEVLSAVAVPLVIYTLVLGLTTPVSDLPRTAHPRVGKWAAATWILSLVLGIVTYALLTFYGWTYITGLPY